MYPNIEVVFKLKTPRLLKADIYEVKKKKKNGSKKVNAKRKGIIHKNGFLKIVRPVENCLLLTTVNSVGSAKCRSDALPFQLQSHCTRTYTFSSDFRITGSPKNKSHDKFCLYNWNYADSGRLNLP